MSDVINGSQLIVPVAETLVTALPAEHEPELFRFNPIDNVPVEFPRIKPAVDVVNERTPIFDIAPREEIEMPFPALNPVIVIPPEEVVI